MGIGFCPRCGEPRLGSFRYCRKCGLDYETAAHPGDVAPGPPASQGTSARPPAALDDAETPASAGGGPTDDLRIKRRDLLLLAGTCLAATLTIVTAYVATLQAVRVALAVLIVFLLPGFAVVCAVLPARQLASGERLLASLGISLAVATCAAVLLGATPIGLGQESFSLTLGGSTIALSVVAGFRLRPGLDRRRSRESPSEGIRS
jgi:Protein of unknown function (DUF1616)